MPCLRATLTSAKRMSPNSAAAASLPGSSASYSARSSATLSQTSATVSHSKPALAARFEIFWHCISAGSETGTESSRPGSASPAPAAARSLFFTSSQMSITWPALSTAPTVSGSPKTCGCRRTSFSLRSRQTSSIS